MSLPTFPKMCPPIMFEDALNMILASIAMEELGLSHIINAEGEKLQYILGTLHGCKESEASVDDVLAVNKSIKGLLDSVMQNQAILKSKMECAIAAVEENNRRKKVPVCPTGSGSVCCAASFNGRPDQYWIAGRPLKWLPSDCSDCRTLHLSPDKEHIILKGGVCYSVSFSLDLCPVEFEDTHCFDKKNVSVVVQTMESGKKNEKFICHTPIIHKDVPVTVSAGGILIHKHCDSTELALTLLAPESARVRQSSICVMEV